MPEQAANGMSANEKLQRSVLRSFITEQGCIKHLPAQLKKKLIVLEYLTNQLDVEKLYTEKEINAFIKPMNEDFATIRRELYIHRFVNRENEIYEVNDRREWRDWRTLG